VAANRASRSSLTAEHWSAPGLEQAVELSLGILPREFESWEELNRSARQQLPTPSSTPYGSNRSPSPRATVRPSLDTMARTGMWPTPIARDARTFKGAARPPAAQGAEPLTVQVGGTLNPTFVEFLMGFPQDWTVV
jgi:hypothetical protein